MNQMHYPQLLLHFYYVYITLQISIFCVKLFQSFHSAGENDIILSSGRFLPVLSSLERMEIDTEEGREINDNDTSSIFRYLVESNALFHVG